MAEAAVEPMNIEDGSGASKAPPIPPLKKKLGDFVDSTVFTWTMTIATFYALFGDDIRVCFFDKDSDSTFDVVTTICFVMFTVELLFTSYAKSDYVFKFYFWLDSVATISLLVDIQYLLLFFTPSSTPIGQEDAADSENTAAGDTVSAAASQGRVVKIIRLIRLFRLVKIYKQVQKREENIAEAKEEPSKIGKKMSDLTTRRLMMLILLMLMVLPAFQVPPFSSSFPANEYRLYGLQQLHRYSQDLEVTDDVFQAATAYYVEYGETLLYVDICESGCTPRTSKEDMYGWIRDLEFEENGNMVKTISESQWVSDDLVLTKDAVQTEYRNDEFLEYVQVKCHPPRSDGTECVSRSFFSVKAQTSNQAFLNMLKTVFIMGLLGIGWYLQKIDSEELVIKPIERMVEMVKQLAENPLQKTKDIEVEEGKSGYETLLLEQTLSKIGGLLQIGFGQAGDEIIGKNMNGSGTLDPMIPGKKIYAIFGFCDIRYFVISTECLQQDVMVFVNTVATLVHSAVHLYSGSTNKNIGEAFLLVWKLPKETTDLNLTSPPGSKALEDSKESMASETDKKITQLADNALCAFIKTIVDVRVAIEDGPLTVFDNHEGLKKAGWKLSMGFGLHIGWAIEGAIGSVHKIDASYLSPHVNMSSRLEAASKQYGVQLLLSQALYKLLSSEAKKMCRMIDRVTVKGSAVPMELFTCDINPHARSIGTFQDEVTPHTDAINIDFATDESLQQLQSYIPDGFIDTFNEGVAAYLGGDWALSRKKLEESMKIKEGDKPAETLIRVMSASDFVAPESWGGFRPLTSK